MKIFTVHTDPKAKDINESASFVPEGFNWYAIVFPLNIFWAISNRCWLFFLFIIIFTMMNVIGHNILGISAITIMMMKLVLLPFMGIWANDFWRASLRRRGFQMVSIVSGKDQADAQLRWLERGGETS